MAHAGGLGGDVDTFRFIDFLGLWQAQMIGAQLDLDDMRPLKCRDLGRISGDINRGFTCFIEGLTPGV